MFYLAQTNSACRAAAPDAAIGNVRMRCLPSNL